MSDSDPAAADERLKIETARMLNLSTDSANIETGPTLHWSKSVQHCERVGRHRFGLNVQARALTCPVFNRASSRVVGSPRT